MTGRHASDAGLAPSRDDGRPNAPLPDHCETVAQDVIAFCGTGGGRVWVDLGSGAGGR